ncbi:uncharacterized protein LOC132752789 [Ruditapes philippinarum]|uniref:uncharacterized protein LOC132752789 n=1 Tax=Ruditapes philippinarum TaxID=129788 RepID=UPI00295A9489|nr:uncharacterized protein LOC132752789 [Ruditapes philippinarum]
MTFLIVSIFDNYVAGFVLALIKGPEIPSRIQVNHSLGLTKTGTMKIAIFLLAVLPFAMSAKIDDKRFIESLLGGYDILNLANQLLSQFGCDETEAQCERELCPPLLDKIDGHNALITGLVCAGVCKEAQVLSKQFANGPVNGVDPCTGTATSGR